MEAIISLLTGGWSGIAGIVAIVVAAFVGYLKIKKSGRDQQELKARRQDEKLIRKGDTAANDAAKSGKLSDEYFRD